MGIVARIGGSGKLATLILACAMAAPAAAFEVPRTEVPTIHVPTPHVTIPTPNVRLTLPRANRLKGNSTGSNFLSGATTGGSSTTTVGSGATTTVGAAKTNGVGTVAASPLSGSNTNKNNPGAVTETAAEAWAIWAQALQAAAAAVGECEVGAPGCPTSNSVLVFVASAETPSPPCDYSAVPCPAPGTPTVTLCGSGYFLGVPCPPPPTPAEAAELAGCPPGTYTSPECARLEAELAVSAGCPPGTAGTPACTLVEAKFLTWGGCSVAQAQSQTQTQGVVACALMGAQDAFFNAVLAAVNSLQDALDSENEVSEEGSMQLQMLMDARSKLLQIASDIEKIKSDTENAMSQNIKQ